MTHSAISAISVILVLLAYTALSFNGGEGQSSKLRLAFAALLAGTLYWVWSHAWGLGLSTALMASVLATQIAFVTILVLVRGAWKLGGLLGPYLILAVLLAVWSGSAVEEASVPEMFSTWILLHVGASVLGYGFVTVGALASTAIILRERALKRRERGRLLDRLPSIATTERTEIVGLAAAEVALGFGILCGMAAEFSESGHLLAINHKSLFSIAAFIVLAGLLFLHLKTGLRGRMAARFGLAAYLLVSLGYPGVKFVGEVLLQS